MDSKSKCRKQRLHQGFSLLSVTLFALCFSLLLRPLHHSRPAQAIGTSCFSTPSSYDITFLLFFLFGSIFSKQSQLHRLISHAFQYRNTILEIKEIYNLNFIFTRRFAWSQCPNHSTKKWSIIESSNLVNQEKKKIKFRFSEKMVRTPERRELHE